MDWLLWASMRWYLADSDSLHVKQDYMIEWEYNTFDEISPLDQLHNMQFQQNYYTTQHFKTIRYDKIDTHEVNILGREFS
jgi:hypothetical protein